MRHHCSSGKRIRLSALALGLLLLGTVQAGFALTIAPSPTAFTYQGNLTQSGLPATGSYDLQFNLFTVSSGGSRPLATQAITGVTVTNGKFTVLLDFGSSPFNGDPRWVQIGVKPNGSLALYTYLSPYQRLAATPYALRANMATTATVANSVPWAAITGAPNNGLFLSQAGPDVLNSTSTQPALAVNQFKTGYAGRFEGSYGTTLYAVSNAHSVFKPSEKLNAILPGLSPIGVQGVVTDGGYGVEGLASTRGTGVYGRSANGTGVYGYSTTGAAGGYFFGASNNDGVYGGSQSGIGGHFSSLLADGSATVTQNLSVGGKINFLSPKTHVVNVSHLEFHPYFPDGAVATYDAGGVALTSGNGILGATVHLPNGARITRIDMYYKDANANNDISGWMYRSYLNTGFAEAISSQAFSSGSTGYQSSLSGMLAAVPDGPNVDNMKYTYNFSVYCPAWDPNTLRLMGARIQYTTTEAE